MGRRGGGPSEARRAQRLVAVALFAAAAAPGCSGGASVDADGGPVLDDAGTLVTPMPPAAPLPPGVPTLTPCPTGWHAVRVGTDALAPEACEPWPDGVPSDCAAHGEAKVPGTPSCARVGDACPAGDFADGLPPTRVRYVLAGAAAGGDGRLAAPFAALGDALAVATAGDVVAVGRGTYDEAVLVPAGVTVWGACVAETRIASTVPDMRAGSVGVAGAGVVLRDVSLGGARIGLRVDGAGATAELDGVVVDAATGVGIRVANGGAVTGHDVVVRDTQTLGGLYGMGVDLSAGTSLDLARVALVGNVEEQLFADGAGTTVHLADAVFLAARPSSTGDARAVQASHGATVTLEQCAVEGYNDVGLLSGGAGTTLSLTDSVVRGAHPVTMFGRGVQSVSGGRLAASRVRITAAGDIGAACLDYGSELQLTDVVIDDSRGDALGHGGRGVDAHGGQVTLHRVWLDSNRDVGLLGEASTGVVLGGDLTVVGTLGAAADGIQGFGIGAVDGSRVSVGPVRVVGSHTAGLFAYGATLEGADVTVLDTEAETIDGYGGMGLSAQAGAHVTIERLQVERARTVGVLATDASTTVELDDVLVADTRGHASTGDWGRGIHAQLAATLHAVRVHVDGSGQAGATAGGSGTRVALEDVDITGTHAEDCATPGGACEGVGGGVGAGAYADATLQLSRFHVASSTLCGLQIPVGASVDAHDGVVEDNPVGVNVQDAAFDVHRVLDGVVLLRNGRNIDGTMLQLPDATPLVTVPPP